MESPVEVSEHTARRIPIVREVDIVTARQVGRDIAMLQGFSGADLTLIATAISELARNILQHAGRGVVQVSGIVDGQRRGVEVLAEDHGPGIPNLELAMQDGYSTSHSLGLGLPGARRLVDEFEVRTEVGKGTTVVARKWRS